MVITDKIVDFILDKIVDDLFWKKVFNKASVSIEKPTDFNEEKYGRTTTLFSKSYLSDLSKKLKGKSAKSFVCILEQNVKLRLSGLFEPKECQFITQNLINVIIAELAKVDSNKADQVEKQLAIVELQKEFNELIKQFSDVILKIDKIISLLEEKGKLKTLEDINHETKYETRPYSFGLDFFDFEDEDFTNDLKNALSSSEFIYITGKSRKESFYCVMEELLKMQETDNNLLPVAIVEDEDSWIRLKDNKIKGYVLLPLFNADEIRPIENNINIFYSSFKLSDSNFPIVEVRRRTYNNYCRKIKQTFSLSDKEKMILFEDRSYQKTKGLFSLVQYYYFAGEKNKKPIWLKEDKKLLKNLLFINQWLNSDQIFFKKEIGVSFKSIKDKIYVLSQGNEPFLYKGGFSYTDATRVASIEFAWEQLQEYVTYDDWKNYCKRIKPSLCFNSNKKPSSLHRKALIENLIVAKESFRYSGNNDKLRVTNKLVENIFNSYDTVESYVQFEEIAEILVEYSPNLFLDKVQKDLLRFDSDVISLKNDFQSIVFAVEKTLSIKEYAAKGLKLLFLINDLVVNKGLKVSSVKSILKVISAWGRHGALTTIQIKSIMIQMIEEYDSAWDIINLCLPNENQVIFMLRYPSHLKVTIDENYLPNNSSINELYDFYIGLCFDNIGNRTERLIKIIKSGVYKYFDYKDKFFDIVRNHIELGDDSIKKKIQDALRVKVHDNRKHCNANWTLPENIVQELEEIVKSTQFRNLIYGYTYLFEHSKYAFPIMHPIPFTGKSNFNKDEELAENEILTKLNEYKKLGLNLLELIDLAEVNNKDGFFINQGEYIAKVYSPICFDFELFKLLYSHNEKAKDVACKYLDFCYKQFNGYDIISQVVGWLNKSKESLCVDEDLIRILQIEEVDVNKDLLLLKQSSDVIKAFWESNLYIAIANNKESLNYAIKQCLIYNNILRFNQIIQRHLSVLSNSEVFDWLVLCFNKNGENSIHSELIEYLSEVYSEEPSKWDIIAKMELSSKNTKLIISSKLCAINVHTYGQIIDKAYKYLDESRNKKDLYSLDDDDDISLYNYLRLHFCPGCLDNKTVDKEKFNSWIENFKVELKIIQRPYLFDMLVGYLLVYSPRNQDGHELTTTVREFIQNNYNEQLGASFKIERMNMRGLYCCSEGKDSKKLSEYYQKEFDFFNIDYFNLATIYKNLSEIYLNQSKEEKESDMIG